MSDSGEFKTSLYVNINDVDEIDEDPKPEENVWVEWAREVTGDASLGDDASAEQLRDYIAASLTEYRKIDLEQRVTSRLYALELEAKATIIERIRGLFTAYAALCWKNGDAKASDAVTDAIDDVFSKVS